MDSKWWALGVVHEKGNATLSLSSAVEQHVYAFSLTIGIESQEPILLLLIGADIDDTSGPLGAVDIL